MQYWAFNSSCCGLADNHRLAMPTKNCTLLRQQKISAVPKCISQHSWAIWNESTVTQLQFQQGLARRSCGKHFPCLTSDEKERGAEGGRSYKSWLTAHGGQRRPQVHRQQQQEGIAAEAELCELAFLFLIKKSCTFLLRCTFSCSIHCHHLENLHLYPNQMALSWCSLLGAVSTRWSRQPVGC